MIENNVLNLIAQVRPLGPKPSLITPASRDEILSFEQQHGLNLPDELKSWFSCCNGARVNPGGLYPLFAPQPELSLDWYLKNYPEWKARGWFPVASDGCGDLYIVAAGIRIGSVNTHPVCFLDQSDFEQPKYAVASGLWKFLYFLMKSEISHQQGQQAAWPFSRDAVLGFDPALAECSEVPLPWEIDGE